MLRRFQVIFKSTMAYEIWLCYLLLLVAAGSSQGQQTSGIDDPNSIIFPGETERPNQVYETTTPSLYYQKCFRECQPTSQYEPVCGDDNMDYDNLDQLQCARNCGKNVHLVRYGRCLLNNPRGLQSDEATSTPSSQPTSGIYGQCLNGCLSSDKYNPVCGTDGIVYSNIEKLRCAQDCGKEVQPGRCADDSRG